LARLGARVAMLDVVGDDWRGELILDEFRREGVCTEHIRQAEGCGSALACVLARQGDGARSIVYHPGTTPELLPSDVPRAAVQSARFLHVNGRHWGACRQAAAWAREAGALVSFDGGAHRYRPQLRELVPLVDVCIVARDFARRYTGETDVAQAAAGLLEQGPGLVVITDGARGSWTYSREGESFHQPAYLLPDVVDTTGCGDSFHGAFLFGLLRGMTLKETASLASAVAALNSQRLGGRGGLPSLEQAQEFISRWE
ncbi:MAG: carbohydrate kinase family protein, partial [Delftia sp.]|nr:carbohydrate kinase family protein [Delftia sp.]